MTSSTILAFPSALPSILLAVQAFDTSRVIDVLEAEADRQGLDAVVDDVVFPALRIVGTYWTHGSFEVAHEHLLTRAVTRWVHHRLSARQVPAGRKILLAAGPDDLHVLGLDCLELLLARRGVAACHLGAQVPVDALRTAARAVHAAAVVVCSHAGPLSASATASVHAAHDAGFDVYYAGSSFESTFVRRRLPGTALDQSVATSADLLSGLVLGPHAGEAHLGSRLAGARG